MLPRRGTSPLLYVLLIGGLLAWVGVTVAFAITIDDPSDQLRVPKVFALGGAVYFAGLFTYVWLSASRGIGDADLELYRRLALREVGRNEVRQMIARGGRVVRVYATLGALTTALGLAAIWFGIEGGTGVELMSAAAVVVVLWFALVPWAIRTSVGAGQLVLEPLGVQVSGLPDWVGKPGGGVILTGAVRYSGQRHGRGVALAHTTKVALTAVNAAGPERKIADPAELSALAGGTTRDWRRVELTTGADGVRVVRQGNGAGGWMLHDLWLAECAAPDAA